MTGRQPGDVATRFWSYVSFPRGGIDGCWLWSVKMGNGYGRFWSCDRTIAAHRVSWAMHRGVVPDGFDIDHLCRNRACVRPDHLEAVSKSTNTSRGYSGTPILKSHCRHGHAMTPDNIAVVKTARKTMRLCKTCKHESAVAAGKRFRERERACRKSA